MNEQHISTANKSSICGEHKTIVLSPSIEMCNRLSILQKRLAFRSKQSVIESAISHYWQYQEKIDRDSMISEMHKIDRDSQLASDQVEDDGR